MADQQATRDVSLVINPEILNKIRNCLETTAPDKLADVMYFLFSSSFENNSAVNNLIQILRSVFNNDEIFLSIVEKLSEDTEKLKTDPNYCQRVVDISKNYLFTSNEQLTSISEVLPQDILDKISKCLKDSLERLIRLLYFLCHTHERDTAIYIDVLRSVFNNDQAFKQIVEKLADDTDRLENDPEYLRVMSDIWTTFLEPNAKCDVGHGQKLELVPATENQLKSIVAVNFVKTISKLVPSIQISLIPRLVASIEASLGGTMASAFGRTANAALLQLSSAKTVGVCTVVAFLTYEVIQNIRRFWNGEISGTRCVKNIIDSTMGTTAAVGGSALGAAIGSFVSPGVGTVFGGLVGGIASATTASTVSDRLTQWIFNLPKEEALENAYLFLGLPFDASNDQINSRYRRLALEYHPDKGGSYEKWHKLQLSMGIIKVSKEVK